MTNQLTMVRAGIFCGGDLGFHVGHGTPHNDTAETLHLAVDYLDRRLRDRCDEGRRTWLDGSGHRGEDAFLFLGSVKVAQGA